MARSLLMAFAVAVLLNTCSDAAAQTRRPDFQGIISLGALSAGYAQSLSSQSPTINQMARASYSRYVGAEASCNPQRAAQLRRAALMQQRRDQEATRRQLARAKLPKPVLDEEQQAAAKFQGAHLLWQAGNADAARRWLDEIMEKYPQTSTAARAYSTPGRM